MDARKYISAIELANELGLPLAWVKAQANTGRIPSLRVGHRQLFNSEAVERTLAERADITTTRGARCGK